MENISRKELKYCCEKQAQDSKGYYTAECNFPRPVFSSCAPVIADSRLERIKNTIHSRYDDPIDIHEYTINRYGDIPSPLTSKRSYVYELTQFKKNPVLLIDHVNRLDHLAGSVTEIHEDEKGLYFKALFSSSMHPTIAHARKLYQEGHAKGISIAGRFHYEDPHNPNKLTLAEIYEISLVAVPADPNSLAGMPRGGDSETDETENKEKTSALQAELTRWIEELKKD